MDANGSLIHEMFWMIWYIQCIVGSDKFINVFCVDKNISGNRRYQDIMNLFLIFLNMNKKFCLCACMFFRYFTFTSKLSIRNMSQIITCLHKLDLRIDKNSSDHIWSSNTLSWIWVAFCQVKIIKCSNIEVVSINLVVIKYLV